MAAAHSAFAGAPTGEIIYHYLLVRRRCDSRHRRRNPALTPAELDHGRCGIGSQRSLARNDTIRQSNCHMLPDDPSTRVQGRARVNSYGLLQIRRPFLLSRRQPSSDNQQAPVPQFCWRTSTLLGLDRFQAAHGTGRVTGPGTGWQAYDRLGQRRNTGTCRWSNRWHLWIWNCSWAHWRIADLTAVRSERGGNGPLWLMSLWEFLL